MRHVQPEVFGPIAKPSLDWEEIRAYLSAVGGEAWADRRQEMHEAVCRERGWQTLPASGLDSVYHDVTRGAL